jgi:serine/threonine protein kinase
MAFAPGSAGVWRDYVREKAIGRGRSGRAVLLRRPSDEHRVVVKQVELDGLSAKERAECENEVVVLRMLCHPNILTCLDSVSSGVHLNIVTEYCAGGTLDARLRRARTAGEPLAEAQIFSWLVQLADALAHMHSRRVLHRDVKAANIFLAGGEGESQLVKLGDLGVARVLSAEAAMAETMIGTPYYLSPELVQGMPYGAQSDVWALGVVLYEMCALRRPFTGENISTLAWRICQAECPPPQLERLPSDGPWTAALSPARHGGAYAAAIGPDSPVLIGTGTVGPPPAVAGASASTDDERSDSHGGYSGYRSFGAGGGGYPLLSGRYSAELYSLVYAMLRKDPSERLELDSFLGSEFVLDGLPAMLRLDRGLLRRLRELVSEEEIEEGLDAASSASSGRRSDDERTRRAKPASASAAAAAASASATAAAAATVSLSSSAVLLLSHRSSDSEVVWQRAHLHLARQRPSSRQSDGSGSGSRRITPPGPLLAGQKPLGARFPQSPALSLFDSPRYDSPRGSARTG